jgi:Uma2 family endonuclease
MRIRVASGHYTYPDVTVVCGERQFAGQSRDTLLNPTLLVEVLSPSTEAYDRGFQFEQYGTIESLSEYLLVSSGRISATLFARQPDGRWLLTAATPPWSCPPSAARSNSRISTTRWSSPRRAGQSSSPARARRRATAMPLQMASTAATL